MKLKYIGALPEAEIHLRNEQVVTVKHNHQFDVPDDEAGHVPDVRLEPAMAELAAATAASDHVLAAKLRDEIAGLDMGDGLLAQTDNYAAVDTKASKKDGDK